jgi:hypothetical protein
MAAISSIMINTGIVHTPSIPKMLSSQPCSHEPAPLRPDMEVTEQKWLKLNADKTIAPDGRHLMLRHDQ